MVPLGRTCQRGTQASELLEVFSSLAWVLGTKEFIIAFHTTYMHVTDSSVYTICFTQVKKRDGVCPDSALFLSNPLVVLSWQKGDQGPSSQFLSVFEWVVGLWEVRASPLQLGSATREREGRGEAAPGQAGWLCCFCQLWGLGQGSGPPVVSLIQHEHNH